MEVTPTESRLRKKAPLPSTGKLSAGRQFERVAALLCRRRGYRLLKKNLWLSFGEIDLLVRDDLNQYVIIEVRGRQGKGYRPIEMLTGAKRDRLKRLAVALSRSFRAPVRIEFLEILGEPDWRAWWRLRLGLQVARLEHRWYRIE